MANAEEDYFFTCPYCGGDIALRADYSGGSRQSFSYDCEVCCRSIQISFVIGSEGIENFHAERE